MLRVVAALIEDEGKWLVCQRRKWDTFGGMWEFPGGKVKEGESLEGALARELREELGTGAEIGVEVHRARHRYAQMKEELELVFFRARVDAGAIQNLAFETMEWREAKTLSELDFLQADRELIEQLAAGRLPMPAPGSAGRKPH
ncbi:MAG: (deoxy)nucleoside triphosphate pyrophosphohydrolase [Candidatus Acidiferrales bacterium]